MPGKDKDKSGKRGRKGSSSRTDAPAPGAGAAAAGAGAGSEGHYVSPPMQHIWDPVSASSAWCELCRGFIWGVGKRAQKCRRCEAVVHPACVDEANKLVGSTFACSKSRQTLDRKTTKQADHALRKLKKQTGNPKKMYFADKIEGLFADADLLADAGEMDRVCNMLLAAKRAPKYKDNAELRKRLVEALIDQERMEEAGEEVTDYLFTFSNDADGYVLRARICTARGDTAGFSSALDEALRLDTNNFDARLLRAEAGDDGGVRGLGGGAAAAAVGAAGAGSRGSVGSDSGDGSGNGMASIPRTVIEGAAGGAAAAGGSSSMGQMRRGRSNSDSRGDGPPVSASSHQMGRMASTIRVPRGAVDPTLRAYDALDRFFASKGAASVAWHEVEGILRDCGVAMPSTAAVLFSHQDVAPDTVVVPQEWQTLKSWLEGLPEPARVCSWVLNFAARREFYGFLSANDAVEKLTSMTVSSWLLRMSAQGGAIVISCKSKPTIVDHKRVRLSQSDSGDMQLYIPDSPGHPTFEGDSALDELIRHGKSKSLFLGKALLLRQPCLREQSGHADFQSTLAVGGGGGGGAPAVRAGGGDDGPYHRDVSRSTTSPHFSATGGDGSAGASPGGVRPAYITTGDAIKEGGGAVAGHGAGGGGGILPPSAAASGRPPTYIHTPSYAADGVTGAGAPPPTVGGEGLYSYTPGPGGAPPAAGGGIPAQPPAPVQGGESIYSYTPKMGAGPGGPGKATGYVPPNHAAAVAAGAATVGGEGLYAYTPGQGGSAGTLPPPAAGGIPAQPAQQGGHALYATTSEVMRPPPAAHPSQGLPPAAGAPHQGGDAIYGYTPPIQHQQQHHHQQQQQQQHAQPTVGGEGLYARTPQQQ